MGNLKTGLLFSLIPACCNITGLDTPHKRFFKRLIIGGSLFAISSLLTLYLTELSVPLPLTLIGLTMLLGVTAEISPLHGRLLPGALIAAIFTLSLAGRMSSWQLPLFYIFGTTWYGLFNWMWFSLWKEQPMRETLSLLYRELADYCEKKYTLLNSLTDVEKTLPMLLARQQKTVDLITLCYQQMHMLAANRHNHYKRLTRSFQLALDLQEHIAVSLTQPQEVQHLVDNSFAEAIIRWNALTIANRLRVLAADILYHRMPSRFNMDKQLSALEKLTRQYDNNPVGHFCWYHFSRIARALRTQRPLYQRDLMAERQRLLPLIPALRSYLSLKSVALRNAARIAVMLSFGSAMALFLNIPKPYWVLMTIMFVSQNGYSATRVRIQHRALGTLAGLMIAAIALRLAIPDSIVLLIMLIITLISYLFIRQYYGWATTGFTIIAVYSLQLLSLNGADFLLSRLLDTLFGCLIAFGGMVWLWPQWQSGLIKKNAHDALDTYQQALQLLLGNEHQPERLAYQRIRVNQANNALFNSLDQAMREPGFNTSYLADMRLWIIHSQFIVEHINAMTILAREHTMLTSALAERYLQSSEIALQRCQQRLEYDAPITDINVMEDRENVHQVPLTVMERHVRHILNHLQIMYTISSLAWAQRPHHGGWLTRKSGKD